VTERSTTSLVRPPSIPEDLLTPADALAEEMNQRWQAGERPRAEEFFSRCPDLASNPEQAVRLIYEEICLRQQEGEEPDPAEILRRFPQWDKQLAVLLECHRLLKEDTQEVVAPAPVALPADHVMVAELGRGAQGKVYLARQRGLADRLVVLKVTPRIGHEHLSLARLNHTHIVPLYAANDDPQNNLRTLCMPYFGGATLQQVLARLGSTTHANRTGQHLLNALDWHQAQVPVAFVGKGPARQYLAQASYVQAICWIGVCLAEALDYAHEHGLVHLDLKPGNVLLTADGQPMLLDFHLAQQPLAAGQAPPDRLGGTALYLSPEQLSALTAVSQGRPVPAPVDGRSDLYSLGLLLYEALAGFVPPDGGKGLALPEFNPAVSPGLADIIGKCLAGQPEERYQTAAGLSQDLRRHLNQRPLLGVPNRSWAERWRKWRKRKPQGLTVAVLVSAVLLAATSMGLVALVRQGDQRQEAEQALDQGGQQLRDRAYAQAVQTLSRGLAAAENLSSSQDRLLHGKLQLARRGQAVQQLHHLVDQLRFLYGSAAPASSAPLPTSRRQELDTRFREVWDKREWLLDRHNMSLGKDTEQELEADLLDLATIWADLGVRLASVGDADQARREVLLVLEETERLFGPSAVVCRQRQACAAALGQRELAAEAGRRADQLQPRSGWEYAALGRALLASGQVKEAASAFEQALQLQPGTFWPNFYQGVCAYRLAHYQEAITAFRVCIALAPENAECHYNRALAEEALGNDDRALAGYDRALELQPGLGSAALNRALLHFKSKRSQAALADLQRARAAGCDPAVVCYNLALVYLDQQDRLAALANLRQALQANPQHKDARALLNRLEAERKPGAP
jgi:eukaryotic-like serine/threonine-protein kinase